MTGKWHVNLPVEKLFDVVKNKKPGCLMTIEDYLLNNWLNGKKNLMICKI